MQDHPVCSTREESDERELGRERDRVSRRGTRVRIDAGSGGPAAPGQDLAPGRGSLLRAFHAWGGPLGRKGPLISSGPEPEPERRAEPRHNPAECLAWVGWRTWRGFRMNDAVLINLSRGGARVFLDERPPQGRAVWVFLEAPGRNAVVKAQSLDVKAAPTGQFSARVEFLEVCPYALFEAAVCGLAPSDPRTRLAPTPRLARRANRVAV